MISVMFRRRQEKNMDILCIVTGEKGDGKSNLIMKVAESYLRLFGLKCKDCKEEWVFKGIAIKKDEYDQIIGLNSIFEPCPYCKSENIARVKSLNFIKYMAYDSEDLTEKIFSLPKFSPLLGDEAARWALGEDWARAENKDLKKLMIQIRTKNLILFANIPEFATVDSKYRNMANYWIRVLQRDDKRALALFLRKTKGEVKDRWQMEEFNKLLGNYNEETPMPQVMQLAQRLRNKHRCVVDYILVRPMKKEIYHRYQKYRNKKVFERNEGNDVFENQRQYAFYAAYNFKYNFNEIFQKAKMFDKKPTDEYVAEALFTNPYTKKSLGGKSISLWIRDIRKRIEKIELIQKKHLNTQESENSLDKHGSTKIS